VATVKAVEPPNCRGAVTPDGGVDPVGLQLIIQTADHLGATQSAAATCHHDGLRLGTATRVDVKRERLAGASQKANGRVIQIHAIARNASAPARHAAGPYAKRRGIHRIVGATEIHGHLRIRLGAPAAGEHREIGVVDAARVQADVRRLAVDFAQ